MSGAGGGPWLLLQACEEGMGTAQVSAWPSARVLFERLTSKGEDCLGFMGRDGRGNPRPLKNVASGGLRGATLEVKATKTVRRPDQGATQCWCFAA